MHAACTSPSIHIVLGRVISLRSSFPWSQALLVKCAPRLSQLTHLQLVEEVRSVVSSLAAKPGRPFQQFLDVHWAKPVLDISPFFEQPDDYGKLLTTGQNKEKMFSSIKKKQKSCWTYLVSPISKTYRIDCEGVPSVLGPWTSHVQRKGSQEA